MLAIRVQASLEGGKGAWGRRITYLAVPGVELSAGSASNAVSAAGVADTTALAPLLGGAAAGLASRGGNLSSAASHAGGRSGRSNGGGRVAGSAAVEARDGRADGAEADVGEDDVAVGDLGLNLGRDTGGGRASTALGAGGAGLVDGVGRVEPEHVGVVVIPDGHDQDHRALEGLAHLSHTALAVEVIDVTEGDLLGIAPLLGDGVAGVAGDLGLGVGNDLAVLNVEALDLAEDASRVLVELGDDGHLLGGVDGHALAVEGLVALAVGVEVAAIRIANTSIALRAVGATAAVALAAALADNGARVRSEGSSHVVGLPDIHLRAAAAIAAETGVGIIGRRGPVLNVGLAVDELKVARALSIAVAGTVLGASLVARVLAHTTISVHGDEVEGTVETAAQVRDIDIEGELVAEELEHLVLGVVLHQVDTRADIGAVLVLGDELEVQGVTAGGDTIGRRVVSAVDAAGLGAALAIRADGGIPLVAGVAVGRAGNSVSPAPVGIDGDGAVHGRAVAARGAALPSESGVGLSGEGASLLGGGASHEGGESGELLVHHFENWKERMCCWWWW